MRPKAVTKAVNGTVSRWTVIWRKALFMSKREYTFSFSSLSKVSSTRGMGSWLRVHGLLSLRKLTVIRMPPFFLGMTTDGLEYGETEC